MIFDVQGLKYGKLFLKRSFLPAFLHYFRICSLNLTFLLTVTPRSFCCPFFPNPTFSIISKHMVAAPPPPPPLILGAHLKISDQNNWGGGPQQKINFFFLGGSQILGGPMNIVGKGGHTPPPFSKIPLILEIQISPPFIGLSGKQKY